MQAAGAHSVAGGGGDGCASAGCAVWVAFLKSLGVLEVVLAVWVISGVAPALCAVTQTAVLVTLNVNGLLWSRRFIHEPLGMVVKNAAFLSLVWICGAMPGARW